MITKEEAEATARLWMNGTTMDLPFVCYWLGRYVVKSANPRVTREYTNELCLLAQYIHYNGPIRQGEA